MSASPGIRKRFLSTVLMTDIVGSTELAAELGDSGWRDLVQMHHGLVRAALRRHGGREMDTAGDGFFAVFDAPAAAVDCALDVANGVRKLGIEIRAGVHVGEVEQIAGKLGGITVPIASRIMAAAGQGEVLVSATVRELAAGSGLIFEDRGVRQLKGVPGEWHVFAAAHAEPNPDELMGFPTAQERRAAAVRWSEARPVWQRHPRMTAGTALVLAVLLATSGLLVWRPWQPPALASLAENSIGVIDPDRNELIGQIPVGIQPGGIAFGEGYVWVTNTGADTVSQIDLATRSAVNRIPVGRAPTGIVVEKGSIWVTNSGERTVSRINAATGAVVDKIEVGNGPTAIASSAGFLWVANTTDSTVIQIDATSGSVGRPVGVGAKPIGLAADENGLWVASEDGASITRLDPVSGIALAAPILLASRPRAIALDADALWVASGDGTVTRVDPSARVTATVDVGTPLGSIALGLDAVWVADLEGHIYRLSASDPSSTPTRISTGSSVGALAVVDGDLWGAAQASAASHQGGTLRIVAAPFRVSVDRPRAVPYDTDPLDHPVFNASLLEADGLIGYRRVGGTLGSTLLPDLAVAIPPPTNAGATYTFQLRPNLEYSNSQPVRAGDFRRAIERSFQVGGIFGVVGPQFYQFISGADTCIGEDADTPVVRCDLSSGIQSNETTRTIIFNLSEPDPDFIYKLAMPSAYPVPDGVPMNELVTGVFPGTGPYVVAKATDDEIRLTRNPNFRVWDAAVRPDGYPDEIVFGVQEDDAQRIEMVESGAADYLAYRSPARGSPELFGPLKTQYPGQWHVGSFQTINVLMNTTIPPFDNVDARRAVNFAIDRGYVADLFGGPPDVAITCQILPPGWPGYEPYCPYTLHPDAGGRWHEPDLETAQRLIDSSGTRGAHVVVGPSFDFTSPTRDYLSSLLAELGYEVTVDTETDFDVVFQAMSAGGMQIQPNGWTPDYLAPSNFFTMFTCDGTFGPINYCDPDFDQAFNQARDLQASDPSAAAKAWAAVDRRAVDLALWAPLYNAGGDFVSERVGNYQFSPGYGVLFDQMWVQ
jgi:peptide/nickel transport system substrate-binding protein